jgi:hypothetical protein
MIQGSNPSNKKYKCSEPCKVAVALFFFHLGVYVLFVAPICIDNLVDFRLTENIVLNSQLNANGLSGPLRQYLTREDTEGNLLPKRGIGQGILQAPLYAFGHMIGCASPDEGTRRDMAALGVAMFNPTVTAATVALLFLFCINLQYSKTASLVVAIVYGLASSAFIFAEYNWNSGVVAFALLTSFYLLHKNKQRPSSFSVVFSGFVVGCAIFVRADFVIVAPVLALYLCLSDGHRGGEAFSFSGAFKSVSLFLAPIALCIILFLWLNHVLFGHILTTGYGDAPWHYAQSWRKTFPQNARSLLIGANSGILVYSPIVVIALLGLPLFIKKHAPEAIAVISLILTIFGFYALFWPVAWASFEWGNRFIFPVVCVAMLSLAPMSERILASRFLRVAAIPLIVMLIGIQTLGVTQFLYKTSTFQASHMAEDFSLPPERMRLHARELFAGHQNIWWMGGYSNMMEMTNDHPGAGIPPALPLAYPRGWLALLPLCAIVVSGAYLGIHTRQAPPEEQ